MTFCRINTVIKHTYSVNNTPLSTCNNYIKDLGFTLIRNLCPNMNIQIICCKALKLLGFINLVSKDLRLLTPLKALFFTLVCLILEPWVWNHPLGPVHRFCTYDIKGSKKIPPSRCLQIKHILSTSWLHTNPTPFFLRKLRRSLLFS